MLMALNMLAMVFLSLMHSPQEHDSHGLRKIVQEPAFRSLVLEGHFGEYGARVEQSLSERLARDLSARGGHGGKAVPGAVRELFFRSSDAKLGSLLGVIKSALALATFITELQALGPVKAMNAAVGWVESGLIRQSGLKAEAFPSFFGLISRPTHLQLDEQDQSALQRDLDLASGKMDSSYLQLADRVEELL
jgi:hypothetical protein